MRIVFMGSAELSCWCLRTLVEDSRFDVAAAVTQPDRPRGRHLHVAPCAAREVAEQAGVPVLSPVQVNAPDSVHAIASFLPEAIVVVAYGQILRPSLLDLPRFGCINVHFSLLPKYRGAAPIQWAIVNGETETGITIMFMNEGMDTGDIITRSVVPILADDTAGILHDRLAEAGASLLPDVLTRLGTGNVTRVPQRDDEASLAPKLSKAHGRIDWTRSSQRLYNQIRGFNPWPGCFTLVPGSRKCTLRVMASVVVDAQGRPGEVIALGADGPVVATGDGALCLTEVQPEGGRRMPGAAYLCGHAVKVGACFE